MTPVLMFWFIWKFTVEGDGVDDFGWIWFGSLWWCGWNNCGQGLLSLSDSK